MLSRWISPRVTSGIGSAGEICSFLKGMIVGFLSRGPTTAKRIGQCQVFLCAQLFCAHLDGKRMSHGKMHRRAEDVSIPEEKRVGVYSFALPAQDEQALSWRLPGLGGQMAGRRY